MIDHLLSILVPRAYAACAEGVVFCPEITGSQALTKLENGPAETVERLYTIAFTALTTIAGVAAILFIIYYGIRMISSAGDPAKYKAARSNLINALLGVLVITVAYTLFRFAEGISQFIGRAF